MGLISNYQIIISFILDATFGNFILAEIEKSIWNKPQLLYIVLRITSYVSNVRFVVTKWS